MNLQVKACSFFGKRCECINLKTKYYNLMP